MIAEPSPIVSFMQLLPALILLSIIGIAIFSIGGSKTNPVIRVLWFILAGWWLGLLWFTLSLALMISIIFFPIGAWAATKTWKIMTLAGSESPKDAVSDVSVEVENKMSQEVNNEANTESKEDAEEDNFDKIEKLKDLKDDGVISEEEFEEKKDELMEDL